MGTTNFLQFNPNQVNQETDALYAADTSRTGGAPANAIFASALANKLFYQLTTFVAAFANMMAGKGYSTSDSSLGVLEGALANVLTNADLRHGIVTVPYSSTPTFDCSAASVFSLSLSGNVSLSVINASPGQAVLFIFIQDAAGSRTVAFPGNVAGPFQPVASSGAVSAQSFIVGVDLVLRATSGVLSFNGIANTPIGATGASSGVFTSLTASSLAAGTSSLGAAIASSLAIGAPNLSTPGTIPLANGILLKWANSNSINGWGGVSASWDTPFPTACLFVLSAPVLDNFQSSGDLRGLSFAIQPGPYTSGVNLFCNPSSYGSETYHAIVIGIGH